MLFYGWSGHYGQTLQLLYGLYIKVNPSFAMIARSVFFICGRDLRQCAMLFSFPPLHFSIAAMR